MKQLPWYSLVIGLVLIVGFGSLCYYLVIKSGAIDNDAGKYKWDRLVMIFNAVQAMAAAAVGAILGTTVQQARVQAAEGQAAANKQDADKAAAARQLVNGLQAPGAGADPGITALKAILN